MRNKRSLINQLRVAYFIPLAIDNSDRTSSPEDQGGTATCGVKPVSRYGQCRYSTPCVDYVTMIPNINYGPQRQSALVSPLASPFDRPVTSYCRPRIKEYDLERRLRVLDFSLNVRQGYRNQFHQYNDIFSNIKPFYYPMCLNLFF